MATKVLLPFNSSTDIGIFSVEADRIRPILAFSEFPRLHWFCLPSTPDRAMGSGPAILPSFPRDMSTQGIYALDSQLPSSSVHREMYNPRSVKMQWQSWKVQCFSVFPIYKQNHNGGLSKIRLVKGGALPLRN